VDVIYDNILDSVLVQTNVCESSSFYRGSSNLGSQKKLGTAFISNSDLKCEHEGCGFTSLVFCTFISNLDAFHLIVLLLIMNWPFASQLMSSTKSFHRKQLPRNPKEWKEKQRKIHISPI
jgi:hypothetical protein